VPLFHPRLIGMIGSADEIRRAALAYKVFTPSTRPVARLCDRPLLVHLSAADRMIELIRLHLPEGPKK
jgi:hypothetical protein